MVNEAPLLVTGGAGFIGANFVLKAVAAGRRIINLDALTYAGNLETLDSIKRNPGHVFVHGDICDRALVSRLLAEHRPASVIHFAAQSHVDRSIDGPDPFIHTNVLGTFELLEAVRAYWAGMEGPVRAGFRFVHISTDEVFGSLGPEGLFREDTPYAPNSPYSASKAASDHLVRAYFHTYGLPVLTTNCSNNYGPYQFPEKLIPLIILNALEGKPLPVYGDGGNVRDWLYVEDHCDALLRVLEAGQPGETYNIGGNNEMTNLDVVKTICAMLDELRPADGFVPHAGLIHFVTDRPGHDRRYAMDASKLRRELGWTPRESFDTGIRKTVQWYLGHPDWCRHVQDGSYQRERLGIKVV